MDSTEKMKLMQLTREHESKSTKLDWMYGNPKHVETEEYLLGRAVDASKNHVEHECIPPSIRDFQGPINPVEDQVDLAKKLQEDPLVEIHRRQIEARKKMLQNPIKLKQMQQMGLILSKNREGRAAKLSESDGSSSSEDDDLNKKLMEKFLKLKNVKKLKKKLKKKKKKRSKSSDSEKSVSKKRRSDSDTREKRDRSKSSSKKKSKHRSESPRVSRKRKDSDRESKRKSRSPDNRHKQKKSDSKKSRKRSSSSSSSSRNEKKSKRDSNSQEREAQYEKYRNPSCDPTKNYGLVNAAGERLALQKTDHSANKKVLPKGKIEEKKWVKQKQTRLTEDEKEQRRKEMMENAEWKQKNRPKLKSIDQEEKELLKNYKDDPVFLKKYLLKHNESSSVESRIKSNMNNVQRRKGDMDSHFARR